MVVENTRNGEVGDGVDSGYYEITSVIINGNEITMNYNVFGNTDKNESIVTTFNKNPKQPGFLKTSTSTEPTDARSEMLLNELKKGFAQDTNGFEVYEVDLNTGEKKKSDYGRLFEKLNSVAVQLNPEGKIETSDIEVKLLANGDVEEVSAAIPLGEGHDMVEGFSIEGGRVSGLFSYNVYNNGDLGPVSQLDQARENPEYKLFDLMVKSSLYDKVTINALQNGRGVNLNNISEVFDRLKMQTNKGRGSIDIDPEILKSSGENLQFDQEAYAGADGVEDNGSQVEYNQSQVGSSKSGGRFA